MADFNAAIVKTLLKEGGSKYTETVGDNGGATKYGISQRSYPNLDIKNLTERHARDIYKRDYWDRVNGDAIQDQVVAEKLFDCAVNMGVKTTIKLAQHALNENMIEQLAEDGIAGAKTIAHLNKCKNTIFFASFVLICIARYAAICNKDRTQSKFLLGWINRALGGA